MAEGFVLDKAHGAVGVASWVEGASEWSVWTGVRLRGRQPTPISTWRCGRCGFLESYATGEPVESGPAQRRALAAAVAGAATLALLLLLLATYLHHGR